MYKQRAKETIVWFLNFSKTKQKVLRMMVQTYMKVVEIQGIFKLHLYL
jgi:hypothetical protein